MEIHPRVARAIEIQQQLGLDDLTFCETELRGVLSPSYWSLLKRGKRSGDGYRVLQALLLLSRRFFVPTDLLADSDLSQPITAERR